MLLLVKVSILISVLSIIKKHNVTSTLRMRNECQTPNKIIGKCIELEKCGEILTILQKSSDSIKISLKQYNCGFNGFKPKVCCPLRSGNMEISTMTFPTTTTISSTTLNNNDIWSTFPVDVSLHPNLHLLPTDCGYSDFDRIYGGNFAGILDYPWMALLYYRMYIEADAILDYNCGGTIINNRYILTAAHCLVKSRFGKLEEIRIGEYNTETEIDCEGIDSTKICAPPYQIFGYEKLIIHSNFDRIQTTNDIGLIRLNATITLADNRYPICLPITPDLMNSNFVGTNMIVAGWGRTENGTQLSKILLKTQVPIVDNGKCATAYKTITRRGKPVVITNSHICAGGEEGIDSCNGDSGGPLMYYHLRAEGIKFFQHGIVSSGPTQCGTKGTPAVYVRVAYFTKWILDQLEP